MKRIITLLVVLIGLFITSCEDPTPPLADCEKYGFGEVTVLNSTGYDLKVDVTYTSTGTNYEKWLNNNGSHTYKMDKGTVYIWGSLNGIEWIYDTYYLKACEELTYKWYSAGKKSTNSGLYLVMSVDGVAVDTIYNFEVLEK